MRILDKMRRAADPRARVVVSDLKRLDDTRRGLGEQAVAYVLEGKDETVLATLANTCNGTELEVGAVYLAAGSPSWPRRKLLARQKPFDLGFTRRYAEVLAAACPNLPDDAAGTAKVPKIVRVLFSETCNGLRAKTNVWPPEAVALKDAGLTLDAAIEITKVLGGTIVDLVDVLYNEPSRYGSTSGNLYRATVDIKPLLESHPDNVVAAARRIHAASRANLVRELHEHALVSPPIYLHFVVELAGDSSKTVRQAASSVLAAVPPETLEPIAIARLAKGNVNTRAGMVELLSKTGTDNALAALREHKGREKTARIISAIDVALTASEHSAGELAANDDERGYQSIDGTRVDIPPPKPLDDRSSTAFGADARAELIDLIKEENIRLRKHNEESAKKGYQYRAPKLSPKLADQTIDFFNATTPSSSQPQALRGFLGWGPGAKWGRVALGRLSDKRALQLAACMTYGRFSALPLYGQGPFIDQVREFVHGPDGDLRHLELIDIELGIEIQFGYGTGRKKRKAQKGDFLRYVLQEDWIYMEPQLDNAPPDAVWPYIAENLKVIDEAFGIAPQSEVKLSRVAAVRVLSRLPAPPARYFGPLLEAATGETKGGRPEARAMLRSAPQVDQHIVALLDDSRQAIRSGAAEWIAERNDASAIPAMRRRLAKEKSELARAAILTGLDALGEDLGGFIGPDALLGEAEAGLKKARLDKLDWLALDHVPTASYRSGARVPAEVLRWWIFLAFKLKQPGGNALFDIYLGQLKPEDAESFSGWILDSWLNYDTARPSEGDGNTFAKQNAAQRFAYLKKWYKDYTKQRAFEDLKREFLSNYLNSGAVSKGLLALAKQTPPPIAADRVRAYLKDHGSRASQASALLELLAGMGDAVSLQVVIAAATRLKQKGVQKFAGTLVEKVAEAKSWTLDELSDRTIPGAGFDADGVIELPCGEEGKIYAASISDSLTLTIRNPDGKTVKALPGGTDDTTKASKKQLSASRRELKQVITMQSARLYEGLCAGRTWSLEDWRRDLHEHPVMRRVLGRTVWEGLKDGNVVGSFRPTAEGDFTSVTDDDVDIGEFDEVRLAYGAEMSEDDAQAWSTHLDDYEVVPLLTQFGRSLLTIAASQRQETHIDDRKGWVTDTFTVRGAASKLGYERGETMDGGYFNEYIKGFQSAGILAVIEFSGNCLPEENVPAALISLSFERYSTGRRMGGTIKLEEVPAVLLSECWNDYRSMVARGAFEESWEQKMPWM